MINIDKYPIKRGVKISRNSIVANPWNPNKTNSVQQQAIRQSLEHYGQIAPVLVRPHPTEKGKYQIIDGEHRGQELLDDLYVDIIENLSEDDAKKLTVILNETRGEADKIELSQLLASLEKSMGKDDLLVGLPYTETDLDELLAIAEIDWEEDYDDPEPKQKDPTEGEYKTITCKIPVDEYESVVDFFREFSAENETPQDKKLAWGKILLDLIERV